MKNVLLLVLLSIAQPAQAGMYKCTGSNGRVSYQEMPCEAGASSSKVNITVPQKTESEADSAARIQKLSSDKKKLSNAVRSRLNDGDIAGAHAIAVTPEDFALVRAAEDTQRKISQERAAQHARDCARREAEVDRTRKNAADHPKDAWWQNLADAEAQKYSIDCP